MYEERFSELLGYLHIYIKNSRPDLLESAAFDAKKWLAEWCETKNPRLGSGHDRPCDLWDVQDGFDEVDNRLREAVNSLEEPMSLETPSCSLKHHHAV